MTAERPTLALASRPQEDGYDSTGKTSAEIERDIGQTRNDLGLLIAAIERKFAPRNLLDQGIDMLQDAMGAQSGKIGDALRGNPLPLALIGAGLGWMAIGSASAARSGEQASPPAPAEAGVFRAPDEPVAEYAYARVKPDLRGPDLRETAAAAAARLDDGGRGVMARVRRTLRANPLAVGAIGLVAGAAFAFWLPASRTEEKLLGPARRRLRDHAETVALELAERARQAAELAADAATEAVLQAARGETAVPPRRDLSDI